ncbi:MAG: 30S ribosomal protein THX [Ignavibacteriaceae bacterium]|nr:30S ribosomal protein THX [Ignavibacteriaceae bacterium]
MGKGDKRTKRGKINLGTFGKTRQKKIRTTKSPKPLAEKTETK